MGHTGGLNGPHATLGNLVAESFFVSLLITNAILLLVDALVSVVRGVSAIGMVVAGAVLCAAAQTAITLSVGASVGVSHAEAGMVVAIETVVSAIAASAVPILVSAIIAGLVGLTVVIVV